MQSNKPLLSGYEEQLESINQWFEGLEEKMESIEDLYSKQSLQGMNMVEGFFGNASRMEMSKDLQEKDKNAQKSSKDKKTAEAKKFVKFQQSPEGDKIAKDDKPAIADKSAKAYKIPRGYKPANSAIADMSRRDEEYDRNPHWSTYAGEKHNGMGKRLGHDKKGEKHGHISPQEIKKRRENSLRNKRIRPAGRPGTSDRFKRKGPSHRFKRPGTSDQFKRHGPSHRFKRTGTSNRFKRHGSSDQFKRPRSSDRFNKPRPSDRLNRHDPSDKFSRHGSLNRFKRPRPVSQLSRQTRFKPKRLGQMPDRLQLDGQKAHNQGGIDNKRTNIITSPEANDDEINDYELFDIASDEETDEFIDPNRGISTKEESAKQYVTGTNLN